MISPDALKSAAAVIPSAKGSSPPISATISTISSQAHLQMISHWHDELEFIYILDGKWIFISKKSFSPPPAEISLLSTLPPCIEARRTTGKTAVSCGHLSTPLSSPKTSPSETKSCRLSWETRPAAVSISPPPLLTRRGWENCCGKSIESTKSISPDLNWKASAFYTFSSPAFTPFSRLKTKYRKRSPVQI